MPSDDLEPTFGERINAPAIVLRVRRWLQEEYDKLVPVDGCYGRVAARSFAEGIELEVLSHSRGDYSAEALRTAARAVFDRSWASGVLWGFWKPEGECGKAKRRRR